MHALQRRRWFAASSVRSRRLIPSSTFNLQHPTARRRCAGSCSLLAIPSTPRTGRRTTRQAVGTTFRTPTIQRLGPASVKALLVCRGVERNFSLRRIIQGWRVGIPELCIGYRLQLDSLRLPNISAPAPMFPEHGQRSQGAGGADLSRTCFNSDRFRSGDPRALSMSRAHWLIEGMPSAQTSTGSPHA